MKLILKLLILSLIHGCTSTSEINNSSFKAKKLREKASVFAEDKEYQRAIKTAKEGVKYAQRANQITNELVEGYDDLGLYYFLLSDYQQSIYYQSVAVALSYFDKPDNKMNEVYLQRLSWAYAKYNPEFEFAAISAFPLRLVCENQQSINENIDVRAFLYQRDKALSPRRKYRLGRLYLRKQVCGTPSFNYRY